MARFVVCLFVVSASAVAHAADPVMVAGWDPSDGHVLLEAANCTACHAAGEVADRINSKQPPILKEVGKWVTPQYLRSYLADPLAAKPGTTMPDVLHGLSDADREAAVEELTHYLVSLGGPIDQRSSGSSLAQIERGRALYHLVGCVSCHQPFDDPPEHESTLPKGVDPEDLAELGLPGTAPAKPSVPLGPLAKKTTVTALAAFLRNPLHTRPSGWMPRIKLLPGEETFIAAYLLRDQYDEQESAAGVGLDLAIYTGNFPRMPDFESLKPVVETTAKGFDAKQAVVDGKPLKGNFALRFHGVIEIPADGEYAFKTRSDDGSVLRIDGKVVVNNDGQHPPQDREGRIRLTKGRHPFELGFTQGGGGYELAVFWQPPEAKKWQPIPEGILLHSTAAMLPEGIVDFTVDDRLVIRGRNRFARLGCVNCHDTGEVLVSQTSKPLLALNLNSKDGCLGDAVAAGRPKYSATTEQRAAIGEAIANLKSKAGTEVAAKERVEHTMTRFNCYACHQRDGRGGPDVTRADFFQYEVLVDFGDEGRMPPAINEVGAKLTDDGFADVLRHGVRNRTYMATRMPLFGEKNVAHLPGMFRAADADKIPPHQPEFTAKLVDDGRTLVGKKGLICINCHAWGNNRLPGAEGLDLLSVSRRIEPAWFNTLLHNPQQLRPRTRMPNPFPGGRTPFEEIQDGDIDRQIDAMWAYLAAGQRGGLPFGLSPDDSTRLIPTDEPIVFRTFVDGVGAHTILVGYRQRVNVGFDANRVKTAIAWSGDFVATRETWDGRAGQYTKVPTGSDVVTMPDGPAFAVLGSGTDSWPADLPKQKKGSTRTPEGWTYRGYRLDADRNPTFLYAFDGVEIRETPTAAFHEEGALLKRTFELRTNEPVENLHLLVARGEIAEKGDLFVVDGQQQYTIDAESSPLLRPSGDATELLLPVRFEKSPDGYTARIEIDLVW